MPLIQFLHRHVSRLRQRVGCRLQRLTPLHRFSLVVAAILLAGSLILSTVASVLIEQFILSETKDIVAGEVVQHFRVVFSKSVFTTPLDAKGLTQFDAIVRLHLSVYRIVQVRFYRTSGIIAFSYNHDQIGHFSSEGDLSDELSDALQGEIVSDRTSLPPNDNVTGQTVRNVLELYVPVVDSGKVIGVAEVYRDIGPELVRIREIQLVLTATVFSGSVVIFLLLRGTYSASTNQILARTRELDRALEQIQATYHETLAALGAALDTRDTETEGHSRRVVTAALMLGRAAGLGDDEMHDLELGAQLHDVGKIGVPDAILRKPGPLTSSEWTVMRQHPELGYEMLRQVGFLQRALPVIRHHHERYDGTGYPDGLRGDSIPRSARVFSIVDAWDAMTATRPYRVALTPADAWRRIDAAAGTQFDPELVRLFGELMAPRVAGAQASVDPRDERIAVA